MSSLTRRAAALTRRAAVAAVLAVSLCLFAAGVGSQGLTPPRRVTFTTPGALSLNPTLSGDGRTLAFESSADLAGGGAGLGFRLVTADTSAPDTFREVALSRAPAPAVSQDGSRVVFAGRGDPLGENRDGDSEIFLSEGCDFTHTFAAAACLCFQYQTARVCFHSGLPNETLLSSGT